ncbi:MAG: Thiaminase II involved in salvage of thiamin pyrimidine moiety, TenA subgroup with Cys in active site [uncultured Rubrobacteraceae bacterium]|uniref:Aminopyrimidine aminohydrolase n=1 Tax=uncultured Rubrobacteraceae bacterium TaxID=349277 RepID=A0A6J4RJD9_9ACTN|nr:MAG: Thiaminase II involved in salvage of thiamin pyrimidine moiety, TenA subgroup with Cys in active site [uncultured Rubrobacteraceae bacterium]
MTYTGAREGFTAELWRSAEPIYAEILKHPFIEGLKDGSLPDGCFRHYVLQDALYLRDYARALGLAGIRSPQEDAFLMFAGHATGAIAVERSLHEAFLKDFGLPEDVVDRTPKAPTTLAYTSFLLRTAALGEYHEVLGAVLPCYWIYAEVGKALVEGGSPDPRYARWIETYGGEEFGATVQAVLDLTDHACRDLDPARRAAATEAFTTTARYEWMFWNMGWTLEEWPVG